MDTSPNSRLNSVKCKHYFVDEAGDPTLFDRKGNVIAGNCEGCSRYFILGMLDVASPDVLSNELTELRKNLLDDPYLRKVPSMTLAARKTACSFHAKNDIPEVRREVFKILKRSDVKFLSVVRDKQKVVDYVRQRNENNPSYRYHPNELYDYMVRILFKNQVHRDDHYTITFSKRGAKDRTKALKDAIDIARRRFSTQFGIENNSQIDIIAQTPPNDPGLQAVDYFLWSLQRLFEKKEDRYLEYLWDRFSLVRHLDAPDSPKYGIYYTKKKPLTLAAIIAPGI